MSRDVPGQRGLAALARAEESADGAVGEDPFDLCQAARAPDHCRSCAA